MSETVINRSDLVRLESTMTAVKITILSTSKEEETMALMINGAQFKFPKNEAKELCRVILEIANGKK